MHYYQFNIGDYQSHTSHLSETEDLVYRRILDWCYLHEKPLPANLEEISRLIRMRTHSESIAIVLREFFVNENEGWFSERVNKEIQHFRDKIDKASKAGKASAQQRFNGRSTDVQPTNNHKPITNNQEPIKKEKIEAPSGVTPETWAAFVQQRKTKKAQITKLVLDSITKQASLASWSLEDALKEIVVRNWTSFNAEWVKGKPKNDFMKGLI